MHYTQDNHYMHYMQDNHAAKTGTSLHSHKIGTKHLNRLGQNTPSLEKDTAPPDGVGGNPHDSTSPVTGEVNLGIGEANLSGLKPPPQTTPPSQGAQPAPASIIGGDELQFLNLHGLGEGNVHQELLVSVTLQNTPWRAQLDLQEELK